MEPRSGCPINLAVEVVGDRWSLIVLRDIMFGGRRSYRDLLTHSVEGIASNILANRLKRLVTEGMLTTAPVPGHRQRTRYSLTEKAIALVPVLVQLGAWGRRFLPATPELSVRAELLERGGTALWAEFMDELRAEHVGAAGAGAPSVPTQPSVRERLQAAYEVARPWDGRESF